MRNGAITNTKLFASSGGNDAAHNINFHISRQLCEHNRY